MQKPGIDKAVGIRRFRAERLPAVALGSHQNEIDGGPSYTVRHFQHGVSRRGLLHLL